MEGEEKSFENEYVELRLVHGILHIHFKPNIAITEDVAREIVRARLEFTENKTYPGIGDDSGIWSIDKSARDYFASEEGTRGVSAAALVLKSSFSKLLGNFILKVSRPSQPARIFTNEKRALEWLQQYKAEL